MPTATAPHRRTSTRRRGKRRRRTVMAVFCLAVAIGVGCLLHQRINASRGAVWVAVPTPEWVTQDLIRVGGYSRSGVKITEFNDVVVHYVGNPGTTAKQNRNWFDNPESEVSAHFVVGLDGEVIQCLPLDEKSAASNHRNVDTISIEVCHPDDTGKFNEATYQSLVRLVSWLLDAGKLSDEHVIRHYDVTGKECPRYFVRHPDSWEAFRADVAAYRQQEQ